MVAGDKLPPAPLAARVWQLVARLPTNCALRSSIEGFARPWNDLLARGSVVRLLYGLQIVSALLVDPPEPRLKVRAVTPAPSGDGAAAFECCLDADARAAWEAVLAARRAWRVRFVESGGIDHVASVFASFSPSPSTEHSFVMSSSLECTALLCGLLRSILDAATRVLGSSAALGVADATSSTAASGAPVAPPAGGNVALQTTAFTQAISVDAAKHVVNLFGWPMVAALVRVCETVASMAIDDLIAGIIASASSVWATALLSLPQTWNEFTHHGGGSEFVVNVLARSRGPTAARAQAGDMCVCVCVCMCMCGVCVCACVVMALKGCVSVLFLRPIFFVQHSDSS